MPTAPYGSWRSPITAEAIVSSSVGISQPTIVGETLYWLESRPTEGGRNVIVRRHPDGRTEDVNPPPFNARTRVHEYGGGDYLVDGDMVYFANFADQRLFRVRPGTAPEPLTHLDGMRYADAGVDGVRNRLICVREDHRLGGEPANTIAAIDLATGDEAVLVRGATFYAYPRVSPDGTRLAWVQWDHPNMPWDGTTLHVAMLRTDGEVEHARQIAGGQTESICQPAWAPDGSLYFMSDLSGWWNPYRWTSASGSPSVNGYNEPMLRRPNDFAQPLWQLGTQTFDVLPLSEASERGPRGQARLIAAYTDRGFSRLAAIDAKTGAMTDIPTPFSVIRDVTASNGRAVFFAGSPDAPSGLFSLNLATGVPELIKRSNTLELNARYVSVPESIEFPTENGLTAYGFYYPPRNADYQDGDATGGAVSERGELPLLLVMSHGGPTAATAAALSPRIQYWTSRGIAVLDVNYGGSTGFGREYRERLKGMWGVVDVDDCVNGALYLVERGDVDANRLAITGGSAGGFTTLAALTFRDVFKAGASHYGIGDLEALARDTHKFEARYLDGLIEPYVPSVGSNPEGQAAGGETTLYHQRSPIHHVERLSCPLIFFQGLEDEVVPPNQAETMVAALRAKGVPCAYFAFEGEQHGFRRAENIKRSLEAELLFYGRIFGFEPADAIEPFPIENL